MGEDDKGDSHHKSLREKLMDELHISEEELHKGKVQSIVYGGVISFLFGIFIAVIGSFHITQFWLFLLMSTTLLSQGIGLRYGKTISKYAFWRKHLSMYKTNEFYLSMREKKSWWFHRSWVAILNIVVGAIGIIMAIVVFILDPSQSQIDFWISKSSVLAGSGLGLFVFVTVSIIQQVLWHRYDDESRITSVNVKSPSGW